MPVELVLLSAALLTAALYGLLGVTVPATPGTQGRIGPLEFYLLQLLSALNIYVILFTILMILRGMVLLQHHRWQARTVPWRTFWIEQTRRLHPAELWQDFRRFNAIVVMFVIFGLLKNLIPHINPLVLDPWFIASEELLCGGRLCGELLHSLLGFGIAPSIGEHYHWYYGYMSITGLLFIAAGGRRLSQEYLCAFVLIFLTGVIWVYALPTWGPVYALPERFEMFRGTPTHELQYALWAMKEQLARDPTRTDAIFMISGFPSLHVAVVLLGSMYLRHLHPVLSLLSWVFAALIIHSTVYLGWHYVLDDVGSIALVLSCIWLARRLSRGWQPPGTPDKGS